jgi:hypothetical protein
MATFLFDYIDQLDTKWYEVDVLIEKAKKISESEPALYNAICRSISVLIVAHFEGYIKDVVKNVVKDLNNSVEFKDLPEQVKRTYCTKYLGQNLDSIDKNYEAKLKKLINKFDEINCQISHEPFFYPTNKNPNPSVVQNTFAKFGLPNVFHFIHESDFDDIFSDSLSQIKDRIKNIKPELLHGLKSYPYAFDIKKYNLKKTSYDGKTLWQEFLEQINQKRHEVAHGNEFDNVEDVYSLETKKNKVVLLELILAGIVSFKMTPILKEEAS